MFKWGFKMKLVLSWVWGRRKCGQSKRQTKHGSEQRTKLEKLCYRFNKYNTWNEVEAEKHKLCFCSNITTVAQNDIDIFFELAKRVFIIKKNVNRLFEWISTKIPLNFSMRNNPQQRDQRFDLLLCEVLSKNITFFMFYIFYNFIYFHTHI